MSERKSKSDSDATTSDGEVKPTEIGDTRLFVAVEIRPTELDGKLDEGSDDTEADEPNLSARDPHGFLVARHRQIQKSGWGKRVRWAPTESFHLTIQFLGDIDPDRVGELKAALTDALAETVAFKVSITRPELFPRASRARVVACPVKSNSSLKALSRAVRKATAPFLSAAAAAATIRPFRPHITLGRIRQSQGRGAPNLVAPGGEIEATVGLIGLFQSELSNDGAQHRELAAFALGE